MAQNLRNQVGQNFRNSHLTLPTRALRS